MILRILKIGMVLTCWVLAMSIPAAADPEPGGDSRWTGSAKGITVAQQAAGEAGQWREDDLEALYTEAEADVIHVSDPFRGWNKVMFTVNDRVYFWVLKPVASVYRELVPSTVRGWVQNFFRNLGTPVRFVNCVLQGKGVAARNELVKFTFNSTAGVLGFGNPAAKYPELQAPEEDLGQTFGVYGVGDGPYLVWPLIGPSNPRDTAGMVGDMFLNPLFYLQDRDARLAATAVERINDVSFRIGDYESFKQAVLEPYEAMRDAYVQKRRKDVEE